MLANMKHRTLVSLLAIVMTGVPWTGRAQAERSRVPDQGTTRTVQSAREVQTRDSSNTAADQQIERNEPVRDRELEQLRRQLETEVMNRMRYGGGGASFDNVARFVVPFLVFLILTSVLLWTVRVILDNRRWYRMVKVQTDIHTKLLDRFASSQDMVAYMESEAGKRFLESPQFDLQPRQAAVFPYGRILLSAQVGIIAVILGGGLLFLRGRVPPDGDLPLLVFGTLALMLGLGFLVSAAASYLLSRHFGLLRDSHTAPAPLVTEPGARRS